MLTKLARLVRVTVEQNGRFWQTELMTRKTCSTLVREVSKLYPDAKSIEAVEVASI